MEAIICIMLALIAFQLNELGEIKDVLKEIAKCTSVKTNSPS